MRKIINKRVFHSVAWARKPVTVLLKVLLSAASVVVSHQAVNAMRVERILQTHIFISPFGAIVFLSSKLHAWTQELSELICFDEFWHGKQLSSSWNLSQGCSQKGVPVSNSNGKLPTPVDARSQESPESC